MPQVFDLGLLTNKFPFLKNKQKTAAYKQKPFKHSFLEYNMKKGKFRYFIPSSRLGKLSVWLIIIAFLLFMFVNIIVKIQGPIANQTIFSNLILSIPILLAGACAIISFFTGIIGII